MKKLMDFFNYVVGAIALLGLAGGITYGMYTAGGVIWAGMTGVICLTLLIILSLGMSGKFNEDDEKGFPAHFGAILLLGSGLLILLISVGAGLSSLHKNESTLASPVPVSTTTTPSVTSSPSPSGSSEAPAVSSSPTSSTDTLGEMDFGLSPGLIALLVGLAALAVLIWLVILLKQGGNANFW